MPHAGAFSCVLFNFGQPTVNGISILYKLISSILGIVACGHPKYGKPYVGYRSSPSLSRSPITLRSMATVMRAPLVAPLRVGFQYIAHNRFGALQFRPSEGSYLMTCLRYVVFDDAPKGRRDDWTADQIAEALRVPLSVIGVQVVRQHGARSNSSFAGFQARGCSRSQYRNKLNTVAEVVDGVMTRSIAPSSNADPSP